MIGPERQLQGPAHEYHIVLLYENGSGAQKIGTVSLMAHDPFEALRVVRPVAQSAAAMLNEGKRASQCRTESQIEKRVLEWQGDHIAPIRTVGLAPLSPS